MKNSFAYTVVFTFILCFLFVLILSFISGATEAKIAENQRFVKERAILSALGAQGIDTPTDTAREFEKVEQETIGETVYYKANFDTPVVAAGFSGPGLWGLINGYIALSEDLTKIVGFEITDQNETPGLGARVAEPWFKEQLHGEEIQNSNIIVGSGGAGDSDKSNGKIDGISGATRTSDGVQVILTQAIQKFYADLGDNN